MIQPEIPTNYSFYYWVERDADTLDYHVSLRRIFTLFGRQVHVRVGHRSGTLWTSQRSFLEERTRGLMLELKKAWFKS